ncbi:unnamed protein product [Rotaria socialis]|uniref:Galectin n=1 Tax=Rotaria socialis TaxID=392032 RepID=A0A819V878_9BILA|nr:unnamed protein product [Rotaria socialis]CAF4174636.1 unnamed protein product [Rotaria socialis]CAF4341731.1 unnamed protein product [Rotaria socialis]CAF4485748.1 unnamed protein product [Rotaria socialis]CAF4502633.1 unnamed protein product [Rotaria socialis]
MQEEPLRYHRNMIQTSLLFGLDGHWLFIYPVHGGSQNAWLTNYTENILSKLIPNDEIIVRGVLVEPNFYIDLRINKDNIPFHLKSTQTMMIFNSKYKATWLSEIKLTPNPLVVNTTFMMNILIDQDESFNISFDEHIFFKYEKRESLDSVKQINIYGNITLKSVKIIHSYREKDNSMKTLIIGIAITIVLLILVGMVAFYILRRHCMHSQSNNSSEKYHDVTINSLGSHRSKTTDNSNATQATNSSTIS